MAVSKFIPIRKRRVAGDRDKDGVGGGAVTEREAEREGDLTKQVVSILYEK